MEKIEGMLRTTPPPLQKGVVNNRIDYGASVLGRCGGLNRKPPAFQTDAGNQYQDIIDAFMGDLRAWADGYYSEAYNIEHDPRLTQAGQIEKLNPVREKWNKQFNSDLVRRCRNLQDAHFAKVKAIFNLPPEVVSGDPVLIFLQSQEIRNYLYSLPVEKRIHLALTSADPQLLHALDTCPDCLQLLPAGVKERAHDARVKRRRGKQLIDAEDERLALEQITAVLRNVQNVVEFVRIVPGSLLHIPESVYGAGDKEDFDDKIPEEADASILDIDITAAAIAA